MEWSGNVYIGLCEDRCKLAHRNSGPRQFYCNIFVFYFNIKDLIYFCVLLFSVFYVACKVYVSNVEYLHMALKAM